MNGLKIVLLLSAIAILIGIHIFGNFGTVQGIEDDIKRCTSCPHHRFIEKHICPYCKTLADAAAFTQLMRRPTRRNTVFYGHPIFEVKTYKRDRCGNVSPTAVAICQETKSGNDPTFPTVALLPTYECHYLGKTCYAEHSMSTGHLFFDEIRC